MSLPPLPSSALPSACLLLLVSLVLACGGGNGEGDAEGSATPAGASPTAASATPAATTSSPPLPLDGVDLADAELLFTAITADPSDLQTVGLPLASGDFNDDGQVDLVIGAAFADGPGNSREDAGEVYVLFGASGLTGEVQLVEAEVGLTVYGAKPGDSLGFSVTAADINNDGIDDLIAGAPGVTAGPDPRTDQGRAYVFFGSSDLSGSIDLAEGDPFDFTLTGAEGFSRVGHALTSGDLNGDGISDLVVGAPFAGRELGTPPGGPRTEVGAVYVVLGTESLAGELNLAFDDPDFVVTGDESFSQFGAAVATGDIGGDGIDDLVVGAPQTDVAGEPDVGAAYVFSGAAQLADAKNLAQADITIVGAVSQGAFGSVVATGHIDGDQTAELIVSAPRSGDTNDDRAASGIVYLFGDLQGVKTVDLSQDEPSAVILGADTGDALGSAVVVADVDGDGRDDLTFGAPLAGGPANQRPLAGAAYVTLSDELSGAIDLRTDVDRYTHVAGAEPGDRAGYALLFLDLDGDGALELTIAASRSSVTDQRPGVVYVLRLPKF